MDHPGIRTSQRVSRSCTECSRRKIKCDKTIPCRPCIQRNVAHECARPIVRVGGKLTVAADSPPAQSNAGSDGTNDNVAELLKERSALRAQVAQLEFALSLVKPAAKPEGVELEIATSDIHSRLDSNKPKLDQYDIETRFADSNPFHVSDTVGIRQLWEPSTEPVFAVLPQRQVSRQLVSWSLRNLGWIPCAVRADEFLQQHDNFWNGLRRQQAIMYDQRPWLAIYFGLLAISVLYMENHQMPTSNQLPRLPNQVPVGSSFHFELARVWYEAAIMELKRSDALSHARVETVQVAMILTLCHGIFGEYEREQLLNGLALQAARGLNMHHLSTEESHSEKVESRPEWSTVEGRDHGRRLWWSLVVCDWLGSWVRPPSISPATFCVQVPGNSLTDHEILPTYIANTTGPLPSPAKYLGVIARLAYTFYIYIKANSHQSPAKLSRAIEEIELARKALPLHLSSRFPANADDELWESEHSWVTFQRYVISHVIDFMQLSIARTLLLSPSSDSKSNQKSQDKFRTIAIASATRILEYAQKSVPRMYRVVWIVPASTVAAGVFLSLDRLVTSTARQPSFESAATAGLLSHALEKLRQYSQGTMRTDKGCETIERLTEMIDYWQAPPNSTYSEAATLALTQAAEDMSPNMQKLAGLDSLDFDFDYAYQDFETILPNWGSNESAFDTFMQDSNAFATGSNNNTGMWE